MMPIGMRTRIRTMNSPHPHKLIGTKREACDILWTHGPIGVIPDIMHAAGDQFVQPRFGEQFVDICLANAGGHAGQQARREAMIEAAQCAIEHVLAAAAFVAGDLPSLDADERRDVAQTPQLAATFSVINWPLVKSWK